MNSKTGLLKIGFLAVILSLAMLLLVGECIAAVAFVGGGSTDGASTSLDGATDDTSTSLNSPGPDAYMNPIPAVPDINPGPPPQPQPDPQGGEIGGVSATVSGISSLQVESATRGAEAENKTPDAAQFVQDKGSKTGANIHFQEQFVAPMPLPGESHER
ncbi:MAG: hypothetical protein PHT41_05145 [Candidatus Omnitrophica bacterium]|nr:hypothetical protein [Candidatus Omnitrophota bacterium]